MANLPKIIVICGPTASGKSEMAVNLAQKFNGEIISADSRQIYRQMNIGTAKIPLDKNNYYKNIKHHLINILDPISLFNVFQYKKMAIKTINDVIRKGKIPFLTGGTGLYIKAVTNNLTLPEIKSNIAVRKRLEEKSENELFAMIENVDPETAEFIDKKNKRRLIRALEVFLVSGKKFSSLKTQGKPLFDALQIGIQIPKEELFKKIEKRVKLMIEQGLEAEVKSLIDKYGWTPVLSQTINYQEWRKYFEDKIPYEQVIKNILKNNRNYAKRQITWFKANPAIKWITNEQEAQNLIQNFLTNK